MLDTIADLIGNVAVYVAALLGLVALYFLWVTFREWRVSQRAAFGIERDIAHSEMIGAVARAALLVAVGLIFYAIGELGQSAAPSEETAVQATQPSVATVSVFGTLTPAVGTVAPTFVPTDTPLPEVTNIPPLPSEATQPSPVEPTPETARVVAPGGLWLRDAPNGGTIEVLPQETIVQFQEGRELAGSFEWQKVQVLNTPPGSEALIGREGWVASAPEFLEVSP